MSSDVAAAYSNRAADYVDQFGSVSSLHPSDRQLITSWAAHVGGWESLVNRAGMTWRNLPPNRKAPASAPEWLLLIKEYPALVRRPVVVRSDGEASVGFTDKKFREMFAA